MRPSPAPRSGPGHLGGLTTTSWQVLVVSTGSSRDVVEAAMSRWSLQPICCSGVREARSLIRSSTPSLIFCDEALADGSYRELLQDLNPVRKSCFVVISSAADVDESFREAVGLGAFDVIAANCRPSDVQWIAVRALQAEARRAGHRRRRSVSFPPGPQSEHVDGHDHDGSEKDR